jgi:hypothetical protein
VLCGPWESSKCRLDVLDQITVVINWAAQLGSFNYAFVPFDNFEIEIGVENIRAVGKTMERMHKDSNDSSDKSISAASVMSSFSVSMTSFGGEKGIRC